MILPVSFQSAFLGALSLAGLATKKDEVAKGSVLDYSVDACIDKDGNTRCTKPFLIEKSTCYNFEWKTQGNIAAHTTMELREVKNKGKEVVYYRETDGQWTADFSGLVYMDFKPLKITTGNNTVDYTVTYCK